MARAATTSDVFNAIAKPQRREILVLLRAGERPVTELAQALGMTQPGASKHLRVLREVGLVRDRKAGKQRVYDLDARGLRPVHEWTDGFEQFWNESFDRRHGHRRRQQPSSTRPTGQSAGLLGPRRSGRKHDPGEHRRTRPGDGRRRRRHTTELYAGAQHGYTMSDMGAYNETAAERHFTALFALLQTAIER